MNRKFKPMAYALAAAFAVLLVSSGANAGYPNGWTESELAVAPPYCQDVQGLKWGDAYYNTSPNAKKWIALMGKGFWAVHHYCWASINLLRAERPGTSDDDRRALRAGAINDMMYVVHNTPDDFVLLPEIFTRIGEVSLKLKRYADAEAAFAKARELKPDYWPAYFQWAQYLKTAGQKDKARELLETGLGYAPSSRTLQKLLVDLGGDPAKVRPKPVPGHGEKAALQ